jgi:hypothetical protein
VEVPYRIGYADFDAGLRLFARLPVDVEVHIGDPIHIVTDEHQAFRFVTVAEERSA